MDQLETEHGIFTNNEVTGQTAEEIYQEWLENKEKPQELNEIEKLKIRTQATEDALMYLLTL